MIRNPIIDTCDSVIPTYFYKVAQNRHMDFDVALINVIQDSRNKTFLRHKIN